MAFADGLFNRLVVSPDSRALAMSVLALSAATLAARASAPTASHRRGDALRIHPRRGIAHPRVPAAPRAQHRDDDALAAPTTITRREAASGAAALALALASPESALATPPRQSFQVSEDQFRPLPGTNPPIMYADIKGGAGAEGGVKAGQRVAVHFDVKFRRITIATSRQGAGVTGGVPYGFTVGSPREPREDPSSRRSTRVSRAWARDSSAGSSFPRSTPTETRRCRRSRPTPPSPWTSSSSP